MKRIWCLAFVVAALFSGRASAQLVVNDPVNLIQNIFQVLNQGRQIAEEVQQYSQMIKDYEQMIKEYQSMTGLRGFVKSVRNGYFEKTLIRRAVPTDVAYMLGSRYMLDLMESGNRNAQFARDLRRVMQTYELPEREDLFGRSTRFAESASIAYGERLKASQAVMAGAATTQGFVSSRLQSVEDIIDETGAADNKDLKASIDLNTRMQAETALLVAALLEAQSREAYASMADTQRDLASQKAAEALFRVGE
jgi:hypothetical protein